MRKYEFLFPVLLLLASALLLSACEPKEYYTSGVVNQIGDTAVELVTDNTSAASAKPFDVPRELLPEDLAVGDLVRVTYIKKSGKKEYIAAEVQEHMYRYQGEIQVEKIPANKSTDSWSEIAMDITEVYQDCFIACPVYPMPYRYRVEFSGTPSDLIRVGQQVSVTMSDVYTGNGGYYVQGTLVSVKESNIQLDPNLCYKPVIYLYPETETEVTVTLSGVDLTCTYPKYENGWRVLAQPDGTLLFDGKEYNYLYWEGRSDLKNDFSEGFCVKGEETSAFLEKTLETLGLTRREANEFIVYWLPQMEQNAYNVISFQQENYRDAAQLTVTPAPDTVIRVFMSWYGSDTEVVLPAQELSAPDRVGFTVVEWGGTQADCGK